MTSLIRIIKTHWVVFTAAALAAITFLSLWPLEQLPSVPGTDKTHHLIAYTLLMFPTALRKPKNWILIGLLFIAYSGTIELMQPYVNRYGEWLDMLANSAGVVCGTLAAGLVNVIVSRRLISINNFPNILSVSRIAIAPVLVYCAWVGHENLFIIFLVISLLSDALDGFLARKLNAVTEAGAKLDSVGDLATYAILPICAWWLWPEIIQKEAPYIVIALSAYFLPLIAGVVKFHQIPSYHTYGAKAAAIIMSVAMLLLFMTDFNTVFRIAAIFQAIVAMEEIAITVQLPEIKSDVKSIWHLSEDRRV